MPKCVLDHEARQPRTVVVRLQHKALHEGENRGNGTADLYDGIQSTKSIANVKDIEYEIGPVN